LGHTLSLIAWEKAGIIKPGVPIVSAPQTEEAMGVIRRVCADTGARLVIIGEDWRVRGDGEDLTGQTFTVEHVGSSGTVPNPQGTIPILLSDLRIRLLGRHQLTNATTAVAILWDLSAQGVEIPEVALRTGLAQARWPGRFEVLNQRPWLVVDSAHNADSAMKLRSALAEWFPRPPRDRLALVFGASADKDIDGMLLLSRRIQTNCRQRQVIVTRLPPRAAAASWRTTYAR
jgi:dihydrofolate synthase/folylpolyglutamate synthase